MAKARNSGQIYIYRDIDSIIKQKIENKEGKVLFIHGQGGVGKSTLLQKFKAYENEEIPTVFIDLKEQTNTTMLDILLDENITFVKHCPKFEKIREMIIKEPKLLAHILERYDGEMNSSLKQFDETNESYGLLIQTVWDIAKIGAKFAKSNYEAKKKEILNYTEFALLTALSEDFKKHGLFIVDTFEKIKNSDIVSKVNFLDSGEISIRHQERHYRLKDYIEGLIYLMVESTTFVIAGRNRLEDLSMDLDEEDIEEHSLEKFSTANIKEFFDHFANKNKKLGLPSSEQLIKIEELTKGNPLLVSLFSQMAKEYNSWEALDYNEMERRVKRVDDKHGLLFYFTDRITSHLKEDEKEIVWKLVIPRVLIQEIEPLLFGKTKMFETLVERGLAFRGLAKEAGKFYLHDDVHKAIVNHFEKEFQEEALSSWHDKEEVRELHQQLSDFYTNTSKQVGVNSAFEGCYHTIMLRRDFERDFNVTREKFAGFVLGALGLSFDKKQSICKDWKNIKNDEITQYIQTFQNEKDRSNISSELYDELSRALAHGTIDNVEDIDFLETLTKTNPFKEDWSIFYALGIAYYHKKAYDEAIEAYQKAVEINPENDEAYNNMGIAYADKKAYDEAIEAYQKAVEINPEKDKAYYNMGNAYAKNQAYDQAIEAYQKAVEINPENDEAYTNLFELQLTQNQPLDQALEAKYTELFGNKKETFIKYEMLKTLQDIVNHKEVNVKQWQQKYHGVGLGGWGFDELDVWIDGMRQSEVKTRLLEILEVFKQHCHE